MERSLGYLLVVDRALFPDAVKPGGSRPEYSVQFADAGMCDGANGDNSLGSVAVTTAPAGAADPAATEFALLP